MCGSKKMWRPALFILSLCFVSAAQGNENSTNECPAGWHIVYKKTLKSCITDYIKGNGTCLTIEDIRKIYDSKMKCVVDDAYIAPHNITNYLRIGLIAKVLKHDEMRGFYDVDGPNCVRSKGREILQCVRDTLTNVNKSKMYYHMHDSLANIKLLQLEEIQFVRSEKIFNCTLNVMRTSCNETVPFIRLIEDYISKEFVKHKHVKYLPSPPAASRKATIMIVGLAIFVILSIASFIVIKRTLWRRWRRRSEDYRCEYTNKEQ